MDTYEVGDERLNTFLLEYTDKNGVLKDRNNANSYLFYAASPVKFSLNGTVGKSSEIDFIVYRFADVLTLLSEAVVRNSDVTQEAIDLSNKVRIRAGLQGYVMSDISGTQEFIDKVLLERGHELYCGKRTE